MNPTIVPELAPPGAGLPALERFIGGRLFALKRLLGDRESFTEAFILEDTAIRERVEACPSESRGQRILIPRLRGLEDSSRYWSVWMTLDHLRITNLVFARVIESLAAGRVPAGTASIADVKPDPGVTADVEWAYENSCALVLATTAAVADLKTAAKYAHPWFGPLDAAGWHGLAAIHLGIHRAQLDAILKGLEA